MSRKEYEDILTSRLLIVSSKYISLIISSSKENVVVFILHMF